MEYVPNQAMVQMQASAAVGPSGRTSPESDSKAAELQEPMAGESKTYAHEVYELAALPDTTIGGRLVANSRGRH